MGQFAGAMSIGDLLRIPEAAGLFHKAIVQSDGPTFVYAHGEPPLVRDRALAEAGLPPRGGQFVGEAARVLWVEPAERR